MIKIGKNKRGGFNLKSPSGRVLGRITPGDVEGTWHPEQLRNCRWQGIDIFPQSYALHLILHWFEVGLEASLQNYYVGSPSGWFVIQAENSRDAKSEGVRTFGRGRALNCRIARQFEVDEYIAERGKVETTIYRG